MLRQVLVKVFSIFAFLLAFSAPATASWDEARQVVGDASDRMFKLMEDESLRDEARFEVLTSEIDMLMDTVVDFPYISKLVMGKYYRKASADDRTTFENVFRTTLMKTYAKAIVSFNIDTYEIIAPKKRSPKPDKQIVTVEVTSDANKKYTVVYYMRKKAGEWRLVNVVLDGVNLRLTFKNQFADIAQKQRGNVSKAISSWQAQVDPDKAGSNNG